MEDNIASEQDEMNHATAPEVETQGVVEAQPANTADVNMANLRAAKEKAEQERADMASQLEELQKSNVTRGPDREEKVPDYGDDDFVEGRVLKREIDALKKQMAAHKTQTVADTDAVKLKNKYSDFDSVVSNENLKKLRELDPDTAETIALSNASIYNRGSAAYKRIKELGIVVADNHVQGRDNAQANVNKPRPSNSVAPQQGDSPLTMANAFTSGPLTEEKKALLRKEMNEAAKRY